MVFNTTTAISSSSLAQLKQSYQNSWQSYYIVEVFNVWYYTSTVNNPVVECTAYYLYSWGGNVGDGGYWRANFNYDTTTGLYSYVKTSGSSASATDNGTSSISGTITHFYPQPPTCFPSGTPVQTDQGEIRIEKITEAHSIRGAPVLAVTRSIGHKSIIQIPRSALYPNVPSQDTYCSLEHKIFHNRRMTKARDLVNKCEHVTKVPYAGGSLFNVLLPTHSHMVVNNLIVETLHPRNAAARLPAPTSRR